MRIQKNKLAAIAGLGLALAPVGTANAAILAQYDFGAAVAHDTAPSPTAELGATTLAAGVAAGDITPGSVFANTTTISGFESVIPHVINQAPRNTGSTTVNGTTYSTNSNGNNHWFAVASNEDDPSGEGGAATTMTVQNIDVKDVGGASDRAGAFLNLGGRSSSYGATAGQAFTLGHSFSWTITASGGDLLLEDISMLVARNSARTIFSNLELYVNGVIDTTLTSLFPNADDAGDSTLRSAAFDIADISLLDGNTATFTLAGYADTPNSFGRDSYFDDITVNGTTTAIPEPTTTGVLAIVGVLGLLRRRRA